LKGYEKLLSNPLTFIKTPNATKVQAMFIPKHAQHIKLEEAVEDPSKCWISYSLQSNDGNGFKMSHRDDKPFPKGSTTLLTILNFEMVINSDLSFYADIFGMLDSTRYCCPWC
jgi:hypothetical protein